MATEKTTPELNSTKILLAAIEHEMAQPGALQKHIAINAGLEQNALSMLKKGQFRVSLARVPDLKRALPTLDNISLTAAVLLEAQNKNVSEEDRQKAEDAIIELIEFFEKQPPFEATLIEIAAEIRKEACLPIPDTLPADIRASIKTLLNDALRRNAEEIIENA